MLPKEKRFWVLSLVIIVAVSLNVITFLYAYPQALNLPQSATFARDFSAYYIGEWRLLHNPTKIYYGGAMLGEYPISPRPQTFKYAPSFLVLFAPFMLLSYQNALAVFDLLELVLILVLAFFVYKIIRDKNVVVGSLAAVVILLDPLPSLSFSQAGFASQLYRFFSLNPQTFSSSYYLGYMLGNAHVLQCILVVGAAYFGFIKKPFISALLFSFGLFDPRVAIIAFPLLLWYNRKELLKFLIGSVAFVALTNLPFFFYHGIGETFLQQELKGSIVSQWYPYDWIPIFAVASLAFLEIFTVLWDSRLQVSFAKMKRSLFKELRKLQKCLLNDLRSASITNS